MYTRQGRMMFRYSTQAQSIPITSGFLRSFYFHQCRWRNLPWRIGTIVTPHPTHCSSDGSKTESDSWAEDRKASSPNDELMKEREVLPFSDGSRDAFVFCSVRFCCVCSRRPKNWQKLGGPRKHTRRRRQNTCSRGNSPVLKTPRWHWVRDQWRKKLWSPALSFEIPVKRNTFCFR